MALGIAAVIIGFLVALLFLDRFTDGTQALGFLTALFGVITGLVGTYFGIKASSDAASSDARSGAESVAREAGSATTPPTITIEPTTATLDVHAEHTVTATVTSVDGSSASETPVTFTIANGQDGDAPPQAEMTDSSGKARFTFSNNGKPGTDTIEAAALGGRSTATVTFDPPPEGDGSN